MIEDLRSLLTLDNVSPKYIKYILNEVSDLGVATYKRIYGDWTDTEKKSWKNVLLDWSVNPIQQYSYTTGKKFYRLCHDHLTLWISSIPEM